MAVMMVLQKVVWLVEKLVDMTVVMLVVRTALMWDEIVVEKMVVMWVGL